MIRKLIHDPILLSVRSETAVIEDKETVQDLLDTLKAHAGTCVGMAANMIGENKRIIAFLDESGVLPVYTLMLNPYITDKCKPYKTEESCLSLLGLPRSCKRYTVITVSYQSTDMKKHIKTYTGWTAQIVQHEIDHCDGILI